MIKYSLPALLPRICQIPITRTYNTNLLKAIAGHFFIKAVFASTSYFFSLFLLKTYNVEEKS